MTSLSKRIWAPILAVVVCLAPAQAQQQQTPPPTTANPTQPVTPLQPITNPDNKQPGSTEGPASPLATPPTVVTGGFAPKVGDIGDERSQLLIGFQVGESIDSNFGAVTTPSGWNDITNFGAHLDLNFLGRSSDLKLRYAGGGMIDAQNSNLDTTYHQFEASESLQFRRWSLQLGDTFSYLPQSSFGFVMFDVTQSNLANVPLLNPSVPPSQSILTSQTMRLSNTILAQAQVEASQRTVFTFTGGYGLLHYTSAGFLNPTNINFGFGYNYALSGRDTLGVNYTFNNYSFAGTTSTINDSSIQVAYGHHITNRLSFQAGAGPEFNFFKPVGAPVSTGTTLFSASAGLTYQMKQTTLNASFSRGVTGGAGIIFGSIANAAQFSANHQWGRNFTASGSFGFAYNQSLPQVSSLLATTFSSLYASAGFDYKVSRTGNFFVNYNYIHQISTGPVCSGLTCAPNFDSHQIWIGFNFEFRPIPLY
jgi:hypothetical protein